MHAAVRSAVLRLGVVLRTARFVTASPTRSGDRVQARIGFREGGKGRVVCYTAYTSTVQKMDRDAPLDFRTLVVDGFNLQDTLRKDGMGWSDSQAGVNEVVSELEGMGIPAKTKQLRLEIVHGLTSVYKAGAANRRKNMAEMAKACRGITSWLEHGFKHGLSEEDVQELVKTALVKSVLEN